MNTYFTFRVQANGAEKLVKCPQCGTENRYNSLELEKLPKASRTDLKIARAHSGPQTHISTAKIVTQDNHVSSLVFFMNFLIVKIHPKNDRDSPKFTYSVYICIFNFFPLSDYLNKCTCVEQEWICNGLLYLQKVGCSECDYECLMDSRALWFCRRCQAALCASCVFARHKRHISVQFSQFYKESRRVIAEAYEASRGRQAEVRNYPQTTR